MTERIRSMWDIEYWSTKIEEATHKKDISDLRDRMNRDMRIELTFDDLYTLQSYLSEMVVLSSLLRDDVDRIKRIPPPPTLADKIKKFIKK